MKTKAKAAAFIGMLCLFTASHALSQKTASPSADAVMDSLYRKTAELQKYTFLFDYLKTKTDKEKGESRTCEYWYAGHDFLRLIVRTGDDKGSKVVYNAKRNKRGVKAKSSFMPIAISVGKDDSRLRGFFASDWNSDLGDVKKFTAGAKPKLDGESKIKDRDSYKIEFTGLKGEFDKVLLWVDKKDSVLLQYEYYSSGALKQRKTWYDYNLNPQITEDDFKI